MSLFRHARMNKSPCPLLSVLVPARSAWRSSAWRCAGDRRFADGRSVGIATTDGSTGMVATKHSARSSTGGRCRPVSDSIHPRADGQQQSTADRTIYAGQSFWLDLEIEDNRTVSNAGIAQATTDISFSPDVASATGSFTAVLCVDPPGPLVGSEGVARGARRACPPVMARAQRAEGLRRWPRARSARATSPARGAARPATAQAGSRTDVPITLYISKPRLLVARAIVDASS